MLECLAYIVLAAALTVPLIYLNIRFASRLGLIDWPKARGLSDDQVPLIGMSLVVVVLAGLYALTTFYGLSPWFLVTALLMAGMGYFDDRKPLPPADKLFFQVIAGASVVLLDPHIRDAIIVKYGWSGGVLTFFFILGLMNAINFIDGIDGLAGFVISIGALGYILLSSRFAEHPGHFFLASIMIGSMIPFLFVNLKRRRGFLGNAGSYFFSYLLAVMHVSLPIESSNVVSRISLASLCFLVPIADASTVIVNRLRTYRSPFEGDKGHLHHRLLQTGLALHHILGSFVTIELAGVLVAYLLTSKGVNSSYLPIATCGSHVLVTSLLILMIEKGSRRRIQSYFQRLDNGQPIYFLKYEVENLDGTPLSAHRLRRLEARVAAEIRVTDVCYIEAPRTLFVTLRTLAEPLRGISSRLDTLFTNEKVRTRLVIEQGEFMKVSYPKPPGHSLKKAS